MKKRGGQVEKPAEIVDPRTMIEQEKQARGEKCARQIQQLLAESHCQIRVAVLVLRPDGGVEPQIQIVALD